MLRWWRRRRDRKRELLFWKNGGADQMDAERVWKTKDEWERKLCGMFRGRTWVHDVIVADAGRGEHHYEVIVIISQWSRLWLGYYEELLLDEVTREVNCHRPITVTAEVTVHR